ncbi:MAG: hypothetical protein V3T88_08435 [Nitrosomonadaceae bacterium]
MSKYTKLPVEIEAIQFNGSSTHAMEIKQWIDSNIKPYEGESFHTADIANLTIPTLEGDMTASPGDYIIKGVKGEFYPCKPDIFEMTYKPSVTTKGGE